MAQIPATDLLGAVSSIDSPTRQIVALWLHSKSALTKQNYAREASRLFAFVGKPLAATTLADLQAYQSSLSDLKPATQATRLGTVRSLLTFAAKINATPTNVGVMLSRPRVNNRLDTRIIEEDDVLRMIALETNPRNNLLLHLMYMSGCRVSEIAGLRVADCKSRGNDEGQITVIGKGEKERTILLKRTVWKKLAPLLGNDPNAWLFPSPKGGGLKRRQMADIVKAAAVRAGLSPDISPHYLRHAAASHALDNGCPVGLVQANLGHASLDTTTRYIHSRPQDGLSRYLKG
jgi:integrase/recombinase XerD